MNIQHSLVAMSQADCAKLQRGAPKVNDTVNDHSKGDLTFSNPIAKVERGNIQYFLEVSQICHGNP